MNDKYYATYVSPQESTVIALVRIETASTSNRVYIHPHNHPPNTSKMATLSHGTDESGPAIGSPHKRQNSIKLDWMTIQSFFGAT